MDIIAEKTAGKTSVAEHLQKWELLLPQKIDSYFKSVMEMNLADFKANYREHTTHVCLIVRDW